ncbi:MAG: GSCFA domain-containing protein [Paracoccaceae bacterium]
MSDILSAAEQRREAKRAKKIGIDKGVSLKSRHSTWFRGSQTNFNPSKANMVSEQSVYNNVLKGWLPKKANITPETQITAFGSCFADNISHWLAKRNYRILTHDQEKKDTYVIRMSEGMVNSFVIRQQFEWVWDELTFDQALWHGYDAEEFGYGEETKAQQREIFDSTDVFILTFGLSEVWYDHTTGDVFSRTIPKDQYDPERHRFRVSTVDENRENMEVIYNLIRKNRPDAKIIFTLSPIPLTATFRDNSCITSNSVSKSILRVAIDEIVLAHKDEGVLFYWPAYEIVTDVFHQPYKDDRRHVERAVLDYIMTEFELRWCNDDNNDQPSLRTSWVAACAAAGLLPPRLENICKRRDLEMLVKIGARKSFSKDPEAETAIRELLDQLGEEWKAAALAKAGSGAA